ncbi:MAG: hypothetical protein NC300_04730 [Bacteroidales bacterium]|nr:hypothetical protein [Clostridium sp.]MCM1203426.1 hypothetical protein [Bacteroidales bacterium]
MIRGMVVFCDMPLFLLDMLIESRRTDDIKNRLCPAAAGGYMSGITDLAEG